MGVFKNGVGRPSNETIKKRNIFKGLCFGLGVIVVVLLGYILNDKGVINFTNKSNKVNNDNEVLVKEEKLSDEEALNVLKRIFGNDLSKKAFQDVSKDNFEAIKMFFAIEASEHNNMISDCSKLFNDKDLDKDYFACDNERLKNENIIYDYDDVNNVYKNFYGNNLNATKSNTKYAFYEPILYSSIGNVFVKGYSPGRGYDRIMYGISDTNKDENDLTINVSYDYIKCSEVKNEEDDFNCIYEYNDGKPKEVLDIKYKDGTIVGNTFDYLITNKDYLNKLKNQITFKFFLEDGVYKLKDIVNK